MDNEPVLGETADLQPEILNLTIDGQALMQTATEPIELIAQSVAFGLASATQADPHSTNIPGQILQLGQKDPEVVKAHYLEWVPGVAINAFWQHFRLFLDQVAVVASLYKRQRDTTYEWNQSVVQARISLLQLNQLLSQIERDTGEVLPNDLKANINSLFAARNCLEHRKGHVEELDRNIGLHGESPALEVRWNAPYAYISGSEQPIRVSQVPKLTIPALGELRIKLEPETRSWSIGDSLVFKPYEVVEIGLSLVFSAQSLTKVLAESAPSDTAGLSVSQT